MNDITKKKVLMFLALAAVALFALGLIAAGLGLFDDHPVQAAVDYPSERVIKHGCDVVLIGDTIASICPDGSVYSDLNPTSAEEIDE